MSTPHITAALRQRVAASARFRCGYCQTSQNVVGPLLEIDHITPQALGGTDDESNLWLACPMCNSHKADRLEVVDPQTQDIVRLFNPRRDVWHDHFEWDESGSIVLGKTPQGRATVRALNMNHADMIAARLLWVAAGWHPPTD